mmetsp:Transcript_5296/g.12998  ORF Transcript_5296/g.12998 Transcript_5296/m.12998 type:complete len:401 (+) Transcript_5296:129-1331(+)
MAVRVGRDLLATAEDQPLRGEVSLSTGDGDPRVIDVHRTVEHEEHRAADDVRVVGRPRRLVGAGDQRAEQRALGDHADLQHVAGEGVTVEHGEVRDGRQVVGDEELVRGGGEEDRDRVGDARGRRLVRARARQQELEEREEGEGGERDDGVGDEVRRLADDERGEGQGGVGGARHRAELLDGEVHPRVELPHVGEGERVGAHRARGGGEGLLDEVYGDDALLGAREGDDGGDALDVEGEVVELHVLEERAGHLDDDVEVPAHLHHLLAVEHEGERGGELDLLHEPARPGAQRVLREDGLVVVEVAHQVGVVRAVGDAELQQVARGEDLRGDVDVLQLQQVDPQHLDGDRAAARLLLRLAHGGGGAGGVGGVRGDAAGGVRRGVAAGVRRGGAAAARGAAV